MAVGSHYGALPAHDGLWESAQTTAHSLPARLAVEHCVHEARGLDVLPSTVHKFRSNGDAESAALLEDVIYAVGCLEWGTGVRGEGETGWVGVGVVWLSHAALCCTGGAVSWLCVCLGPRAVLFNSTPECWRSSPVPLHWLMNHAWQNGTLAGCTASKQCRRCCCTDSRHWGGHACDSRQ